MELIKKELTIQSDYTPIDDNNFLVDLKAFEGDSILIDLKISVPTKKYASSLCENWKDNSSIIYNDIMNALLKDENN